MITIRKSQDRGRTQWEWLDSKHTFSFGEYHDPNHMGYRSLRVINDDIIGPGGGFGEHPHRDMEIISYVSEGALKHRDSMGHESVMKPGMIQVMSAGSGLTHSEFNASKTDPVHLIQIWITPSARKLEPRYEERDFSAKLKSALYEVAGPAGGNGSIAINQDAHVLAGHLQSGESVTHTITEGRHAYVHLVKGHVSVNGNDLDGGDGAMISEEAEVVITAAQQAEVLVFDLA
ncbi:MAG: quercetin 2,3-dioxygenase [Candidatus Hydrogenedentota bacterium]